MSKMLLKDKNNEERKTNRKPQRQEKRWGEQTTVSGFGSSFPKQNK